MESFVSIQTFCRSEPSCYVYTWAWHKILLDHPLYHAGENLWTHFALARGTPVPMLFKIEFWGASTKVSDVFMNAENFHFHFIFIYFHRVNTFSNYGYLLFYNVPCFKTLTYLITWIIIGIKIQYIRKRKYIKRKRTLSEVKNMWLMLISIINFFDLSKNILI